MSQHDLSIANQGFPAFRSDLNNALQALGSMQSGTSAPATTYANMLWYDTTNNIVKMRNEDNDAWISLITLNQTNDIVAEFVATSFIPSGSTVPTNGLYLPAANSVGIATNSSERVRVDSSGNVGIGTNAPTYPLTLGNNKRLGSLNTANAGVNFAIIDGSNNLTFGDDSANTNTATFQSRGGTIFQVNTLERMRIDSSGNVGIGTNAPGVNLDVVGTTGVRVKYGAGSGLLINQVSSGGAAYINQQANDALAFNTNNVERARIDASGNLLVGTTNTSATAGVGMKFIFSVDANNPVVKTVVQDSSGAYSCYNLYSTNAGAYRFYVTTAGVINATSTTITGISDQRLKENIRDLNYGLNELLLIKPRRFDWKDGKGQDKKDAAGFIAQEFEQVFPNSVSTSLAGEDGIEYKTLCHEELIPTMVKAIQEQQAIIESLTTRIAALEAK